MRYAGRMVAPTPGPRPKNLAEKLAVEPVSVRTVSVSGKREVEGREPQAPNWRLSNRADCRDKPAWRTPPTVGSLRLTGKSLGLREWVVELRGLELRARHAVLSNQSP